MCAIPATGAQLLSSRQLTGLPAGTIGRVSTGLTERVSRLTGRVTAAGSAWRDPHTHSPVHSSQSQSQRCSMCAGETLRRNATSLFRIHMFGLYCQVLRHFDAHYPSFSRDIPLLTTEKTDPADSAIQFFFSQNIAASSKLGRFYCTRHHYWSHVCPPLYLY